MDEGAREHPGFQLRLNLQCRVKLGVNHFRQRMRFVVLCERFRQGSVLTRQKER